MHQNTATITKSKNNAQGVPEGYHSLTSYLTVKDTAKAIEFYKNVFGATEVGRLSMPNGAVGHAEIKIGDSKLMLADENVEWGNKAPETLGGSPAGLCLYVNDADAVFNKAVKAGAKVTMAMEDMFYGDRSGSVTDPFGHKWMICAHKEDMPFDEMQRRMDEKFSKK